MQYKSHDSEEKHIRVYENRSEYHSCKSSIDVYEEGVISNQSKERTKKIKETFESGFLDSIISEIKNGNSSANIDKISPVTKESLRELVDLMTSEVGRALIGLSFLQLSIKAIAPDQNIRLHKGSSNKRSFSWVEGISMRSLDKNYVTPVLRRYDLLKLNADGFMMTRSLAENYPYSPLYKANLRGAKMQWLNIVEELESGVTDPFESLKLFVSLLLDATANFKNISQNLISTTSNTLPKFNNKENVLRLMVRHTEESNYAARLLEVSMHALVQAAIESGALGNFTVKPLSQMRSANKKHGNIGDIEILENEDIIESWDAKYGKSYLREELEEAIEKLPSHDHIEVVGFVTSTTIERSEEISSRIEEITALYSVVFKILTYKNWVDMIYERCLSSKLIDEEKLSHLWLMAYAESLAQKRRNIAPIDEPCLEWVKSLTRLIENED